MVSAFQWSMRDNGRTARMAEILEKMDQAFAPGQAKNELNGDGGVFFVRPKLQAMDAIANIF